MSPRAEIAAVAYGQSLGVQSPGTRAEVACQPVGVAAMVQIRGAPPGHATTYSSESRPASSDGGSLPLSPELITCHPVLVCCASRQRRCRGPRADGTEYAVKAPRLVRTT